MTAATLQRPARRLICREMSDANETAFRGLTRIMTAAGASPASTAAYHSACLSLEDYLITAGRPSDLTGATREDAMSWLIEIQARGGWSFRGGQRVQLGRPLSKASVFSYFGSAKRFYGYAVEAELMEASPMAGLAAPPPNTKPREIPEIEVLRAMIATCLPGKKLKQRTFEDVRDEFAIRFFAETGGPRCSELANLPAGQLDLKNDLALVEGKGGKWRTVPLCPRTAQAAQKYLTVRRDHPAAGLDQLMVGQRGQLSPSGVYQIVVRRARLVGTHIHPHQLRHFSASEAKAAGMSDEDIMRLFGWSTTAMLRHYGEIQGTARAVAAARKHHLGDRL
ncbi:MAG TPA: tyrosine-type recombinase/integrase [Trebonia sp.]|nr:tyrosine-type recombinase/integrase [Trebonia sp.]